MTGGAGFGLGAVNLTRPGWVISAIFTDEGVSGAKGRDQRPGFDKLLKGVARRDFDLIAAWSVDRLGRSLSHLVAFLGDIQTKGVDLYLHQQGLDTSTSAGRAMFGMLGVFAELERSLIRERIMAGLRRTSKRSGRRPMPESRVRAIRRSLGEGLSINVDRWSMHSRYRCTVKGNNAFCVYRYRDLIVASSRL